MVKHKPKTPSSKTHWFIVNKTILICKYFFDILFHCLDSVVEIYTMKTFGDHVFKQSSLNKTFIECSLKNIIISFLGGQSSCELKNNLFWRQWQKEKQSLTFQGNAFNEELNVAM